MVHPVVYLCVCVWCGTAEQWDLAKPIQTCGFQVERRNNDLYLLFTTDHHSKLFALAKLHPDNAAKSVEPVMDSSRYFVVQIQAGTTTTTTTTKSAYIGFGFRDRDVAIDLVGNLQQFQKSIQREQQAKTMKVAEIPKLAEGEKMHISFGNNSTSKKKPASTNTALKKPKSTNGGSGSPLLLKKPPKVVETTTAEVFTNTMTEMTTGVKEVQLVEEPSTADAVSKGGGDEDDDNDEGWGDFEQA
jgi:Protein of unknown function (DUF1681)